MWSNYMALSNLSLYKAIVRLHSVTIILLLSNLIRVFTLQTLTHMENELMVKVAAAL